MGQKQPWGSMPAYNNVSALMYGRSRDELYMIHGWT